MSQIEKLIRRMRTIPKDFTYNEFSKVARHYKYVEHPNDEGSRVTFYRESDGKIIHLHKPHINTMLYDAVKGVLEQMRKNGDDI